MSLSHFEKVASGRLIELYQEGELGYYRGLIVSREAYAEMQDISGRRHPVMRATFTHGTCRVSYRFYVQCSDSIPRSHVFLLTPQTEERYQLYYLEKEKQLFQDASARRILGIPGMQLQIVEKNPITGTIIIADAAGSFVFKYVTFDQFLELAKSVASEQPYWVNTDFISLMKSVDLDSHHPTSSITIDGSRFNENEENYRRYFTALISAAHQRLRTEGARINPPTIRWEDDPDEYDYHSAWVMGGGSLEHAVGKLFMRNDNTHTPRTYFIVGVYKDGWGKVDTYTIPLYDGTPIFFTTDPEEFLRQASIYFHPDEVANYIITTGGHVPFRLVKQLRSEYPYQLNLPIIDSEVGRPYPLSFGDGGEVSARFLTTKGTTTKWYPVGTSDTPEWWLKLRRRFFPEQWSGYPEEDRSDPLESLTYE